MELCVVIFFFEISFRGGGEGIAFVGRENLKNIQKNNLLFGGKFELGGISPPEKTLVTILDHTEVLVWHSCWEHGGGEGWGVVPHRFPIKTASGG